MDTPIDVLEKQLRLRNRIKEMENALASVGDNDAEDGRQREFFEHAIRCCRNALAESLERHE